MSARQIRRAREREMGREHRRGGTAPKLTAAAGAALAGTVVMVPAADAATFNVTNLNDDGAGSLRDAVEQANAADGDDVITFQTGLSGTITLTSGAIDIRYDGLDIQGPGPSQLAVSGDDSSQVLRAWDMDQAGEPVRISGLTLTDGNAGSDWGGALYSDTGGDFAPDLTVDNVVVQNSYAGSGGGGIWHEHGSLTVVNSTVSGNVASDGGGGLYSSDADGPVSLRNSTFSKNASDTYRGGGAAIGYTDSDVEVLESTFADNDAFYDGGGLIVFRAGGDVSVRNSTISGNHASDDGGGIQVYAAESLTIAGTTVSANTADDYVGGVNLFRTDGPTVVENSTISANSAPTVGGLYSYNETDTPRTIRNSTIVGNTATVAFPGVFARLRDDSGEDVLTISSSILANNTSPEGPDLGAPDSADGVFEVGFSLVENQGAGAAPVTETPAGSNLFGVDPQLGPLQDNGGPTHTHAPSFTSPVLDMGTGNGLATDQRGAPRTFDAANVPNAAGSDGTDIGSVELLPGGRLALERCKARTENVLFAPGTAIVGTDAGDVIVGTEAGDQISSGRGKDLVCGGGGDDALNVGTGHDRAFGQPGKDKIKGSGGNDKLSGQGGKDKLKGGGGRDNLKGGGGRDRLAGGPGRDRLRGGGGRDKLRGGPGKDSERQ